MTEAWTDERLAELRDAFTMYREGQTKFTRRMAIMLGDQFSMRPMSMVWRLEKMGLLKRGSWEWFRNNGGITLAHRNEAYADIAAQQGWQP